MKIGSIESFENLHGFEALKKVLGRVSIFYLPKLKDLSGFDSIESNQKNTSTQKN